MTLLKEETLAKKLITKGSLVYIFAFLIAPTGYVVRVLLSNTLSVGEVGVFYSILGLITILAAYNDLGLTEALQYFLPKYWLEKKYDYYKTIWIVTFFMQLLSGIIIGGGLRFGADRLSSNYFHTPETGSIIKLFSIYFVAINFFQALSSVYTAFQDVLYEKIIEMTRMCSVVIFTIIFRLTNSLSLTSGSYARMAGLGAGLILSVVLFMIKYAKTLQVGKFTWDKKLLRKQLGYAFWVFLGMNAGVLLGQVDQQMIVVILGAESAGYYANYLSLFTLYSLFAFPLIGILFPIMTELITKNHTEKIQILLGILYKYFSVFGLMIGAFLMTLGPIISGVLYGSKFIYSGTLLSYAAGFVVFNILLAINFALLAGMGKVKERVKILAIAVCINVIGNVLFMVVFGWGLVGAIIATILGWLLMFVLTLRIIKNYYKFFFDRGFLIKNAVIIVLLSIGLLYVSGGLDWSMDTSWTVRVIYLGIMAMIYSCILALSNYKSIVVLRKEIKNLGFMK